MLFPVSCWCGSPSLGNKVGGPVRAATFDPGLRSALPCLLVLPGPFVFLFSLSLDTVASRYLPHSKALNDPAVLGFEQMGTVFYMPGKDPGHVSTFRHSHQELFMRSAGELPRREELS